jgi:hypothetical protein
MKPCHAAALALFVPLIIPGCRISSHRGWYLMVPSSSSYSPPRTIIPEAACVALSPQRRGAYSELSTTEKEWGPAPGSEHPRGVYVATDDPRLKGK